ncbi:EI24 domain-containing protein [Saccharopolyspora phatthalungensis]|uniref:CysZ protein n=1 Tax=Saccharopolyspora phatthalungensis TaxID=664693 RepID=A0A840PZX5_9PSEU|nr:EI24 domain-containing protein [Saccharopolyspora phatthalungensis]MBB5155832.1 CysZ protein [Saccharopolyspora phatthalungensis]
MSSFLAGTRTLGTGFGIILRNPRLLLLGALPALISAVLLLGGLAALIYYSADLVTWLTPFAANWGDFARRALRILLGVALIGAATLLGSVSFIAVTLLIGGPFYEHIAEQAEKQLGLDTSDDGAGLVRQFGRGVRDSLKLAGITLIGAILVFGIGFIPVAGQLAAPVLGALLGAWVIGLEMVGLVFQRRGLRLGDRHRALWQRRAMALGFGLPTYLLCLVPVAQLVVIPSAVVGGTLLAHRALGPVAHSA